MSTLGGCVQVTKSAEALLQQEPDLLEKSSEAATGSKADLLWGEGRAQLTHTSILCSYKQVAHKGERVQVTKSAEALLQQEPDLLEKSSSAATGGKADLLWGEGRAQRTREAYAAAPRFVLLNFRAVHGLDATAAQTFGNLYSRLQARLGCSSCTLHAAHRQVQSRLPAYSDIMCMLCLPY